MRACVRACVSVCVQRASVYVRACVRVWVCLCVCGEGAEGEVRERGKEKGDIAERQRVEGGEERAVRDERETVRHRVTGREKADSMRQTDRDREKEKERDREREKQTERETTKESKSEKEMWRIARQDARSERVRIESGVWSKQNAEVITFYYDSFADKRKPRLTGDIFSQKASRQKAEDKLKCQRPTSV